MELVASLPSLSESGEIFPLGKLEGNEGLRVTWDMGGRWHVDGVRKFALVVDGEPYGMEG